MLSKAQVSPFWIRSLLAANEIGVPKNKWGPKGKWGAIRQMRCQKRHMGHHKGKCGVPKGRCGTKKTYRGT
jgi:hypothetical protein